MNKDIPYIKLIWIALITAPLIGLFGATPAFVFTKIELSRIFSVFLLITSFTLVFWAFNILLLWLGNFFNFRGKHILRYIISAVICTFIIYLFANQILPVRGEVPAEFSKDFPKDFPTPAQQPLGFLMPLIQSQSINFVIIIVMEILVLIERKRKVEDENAKLRMINLEAKHSQLKQQLHPHFLFNSLSTLRSLIKRSPEQAQEYLIKLSNLLRFSINTDGQRLLVLREELELTDTYLKMQQVRFGNALTFTIDISPDLQRNGKVPAYSIQLLVENAIKHNTLTTVKPLHISIQEDKESKTVIVENNLQAKLQTEEGSGVGLSNLAERYRLLNNEEISIDNTKQKFKVTIKVLENESSNN